MARGLLGGEGRFIGDEDYRAGFNEPLEATLDLDTWTTGYDLEKLIASIREHVTSTSKTEEAVQATIRDKVFRELKERTRLDEAGVYPAQDDRLRLVFEGLLFPGRVEAVNSIVASHDSLPLGITQIGVAVAGYGGSTGTFSQRLFRKELSTGSDDALEQALECLERRHDRSGMGRRDGLSTLARRGIRDYAERAILLRKSKADWRMGQGNPCSREMLSGSGYMSLLLKSLDLLRELIQVHKKFVYVPHSLEERGYQTLGYSLKAGEYAIIQTLESDSAHFVERWYYYDDKVRDRALTFVKDCCSNVLIGLFRVSELAPPCLFFSHREHFHMAAHIAMADSRIHPRRSMPMLLEVADVACRVFGSESFTGLVHDAYTRAGGKLHHFNERYSRRRDP